MKDAKLEDDILSSVMKKTEETIGQSVSVGWEGEVALYMAVNEYGHMGADKKGRNMNIPSRPALRTTMSSSFIDFLVSKARTEIVSQKSLLPIVANTGQRMKQRLMQVMNRWQDPPNAISTVKRKGIDKPLIGYYKGKRSAHAQHDIRIFVNGKETSFGE